MGSASRVALAIAVFVASFSLALAYPTVFPTGLTIWEEGTMPGIVLLKANDGKIHAIAPNGKQINSWVSPNPETQLGYPEYRHLPDGHILTYQSADSFPGCGFNCGDILELDWDGNVVWEYEAPDGVHLHHEHRRLEDGNTLLLCAKNFIDENISPLELRDDCLLEVDPDGNTVWEWQTADHFDEFGFSDEAKALISETGGDWAHANAAFSIPSNTPHSDSRFAPGNIIVSYRHTSFIVVIDRQTGEIVWKTDQLTLGQHNTHMITNEFDGAGNLLVFDNGGESGYPVRARLDSRILEIDFLDMSTVWSYDATMSGLPRWSFFSHFVSSVQRLPNGNTFIDEGSNARFFEVTPTGEIVWEFVAPRIYTPLPNGDPSPAVYRATKAPLDWVPVPISGDHLFPPR